MYVFIQASHLYTLHIYNILVPHISRKLICKLGDWLSFHEYSLICSYLSLGILVLTFQTFGKISEIINLKWWGSFRGSQFQRCQLIGTWHCSIGPVTQHNTMLGVLGVLGRKHYSFQKNLDFTHSPQEHSFWATEIPQVKNIDSSFREPGFDSQ